MKTHGRLALQSRFALIGALFCAAACPRTTPSGIEIGNVTVIGSPEPPSFTLEIEGHGFGLSDVVVDLSEGKGMAQGATIRVEVFDQQNQVPAAIAGTSTELAGTTKLMASIQLSAPLPRGPYGIRLFSAGANAGGLLAEKQAAFEVQTTINPPPDSGVFPDAGVNDDADVVQPDSGLDGGVNPDVPAVDVEPFDGPAPDAADDAGVAPDADLPDTGDVPDTGVAPDSGLGVFPGAYTYRQPILLDNTSGANTPDGVTFLVTVPHATLVTQGRSLPNGADLAVYLDQTRLPHNFDDRLAVNTDTLRLIVQLPAPIAPGPATTLPLALYYGDPNATLQLSDAVYLFIERFDVALLIGSGNAARWHSNNWVVQCTDRSGTGRSVCVQDDGGNPTRRTLGSPRVRGMRAAPPANETYEMTAFIAGRMVDQADDLLYFSYNDVNNSFADTTVLPDALYLEFPPNAQQDFPEVDMTVRLARGWLLPPMNQNFTRMRARFVPTQADEPSLHFRYVSDNNIASANSLVGLDDLAVRRALEPEFGVSLGPVETR